MSILLDQVQIDPNDNEANLKNSIILRFREILKEN